MSLQITYHLRLQEVVELPQLVKRTSRELLNFFPVIAEDRAGKMVEIDAKAVLTIPRQIKARGSPQTWLYV